MVGNYYVIHALFCQQRHPHKMLGAVLSSTVALVPFARPMSPFAGPMLPFARPMSPFARPTTSPTVLVHRADYVAMSLASRAVLVTGASTVVSAAVAVKQARQARKAVTEAATLQQSLDAAKLQAQQRLTAAKQREEELQAAKEAKNRALTEVKFAQKDKSRLEKQLSGKKQEVEREQAKLLKETERRKEAEDARDELKQKEAEACSALKRLQSEKAAVSSQLGELKGELDGGGHDEGRSGGNARANDERTGGCACHVRRTWL